MNQSHQPSTRTIQRKKLALVIGHCLAISAMGSAGAATINVDAGAVAVDGTDGLCSIVEAVTNANADDQSGSTECTAGDAGLDTIELPGGTFTFTTDTGGRALPTISSEITINGNDAILTRDSAAADFGMIPIGGTGNLTLNSVTVSNGVARDGGGISSYGDLTLVNSTLSFNTASNAGGALRMVGTGDSTTIIDSTLSDNRSSFRAGAILVFSGNLTVEDSTFSGNTAPYNGGALEIYGAGETTISNSVFVDNAARSGTGGAISLRQASGISATISNSTFSGNSAANLGGALRSGAPDLTLSHVTLAENTAGTGASLYIESGDAGLYNSVITGPGCLVAASATLTNFSNLVDDASSCGTAASPIVGNAMLGPLQNNGGATLTHALLPGSAAIDSASAAACEVTDQRGAPRTAATCDAGAFEVLTAIEVDADNGVGLVEAALDNRCSLFEAFSNANSNSDSGSSVGGPNECEPGQGDTQDVITLPEGATFTLTASSSGDSNGVTVDSDSELRVEGNGATITRDPTAPNFRMFLNFGDAVLSDLTLAGGAEAFGAGIANIGELSLDQVTVSGNNATDGGAGIDNSISGVATIVNSTITGNSVSGAFVNGGGIRNREDAVMSIVDSTISDNRAGDGGGISQESTGSMSIENSTISGNSAYSWGGIRNSGEVSVTNSTFSGNRANTVPALGNVSGAEATANLESVTIANNTSNSSANAPAIDNTSGSLLTLTSSLIVQNATNPDCRSDGLVVLNETIIEDGSCGGIMTDGSDVVEALDSNGGPTMTHALIDDVNNPAIDAGSQADCDALSTDQRGVGFGRTVDGDGNMDARCDLGSFELQVLGPNDLIFKDGFQ